MRSEETGTAKPLPGSYPRQGFFLVLRVKNGDALASPCGFRVAKSRASFLLRRQTKGAKEKAPPGRRSGRAFFLGTFFLQDKQKYLSCWRNTAYQRPPTPQITTWFSPLCLALQPNRMREEFYQSPCGGREVAALSIGDDEAAAHAELANGNFFQA